MMRIFLAVVLLAGGGGEVHAQGIGTLPATADCNMVTLSARVAALSSQCCGDGADCVCTIACSSTLLPLIDECRPLLDALLDMDDGTRDGVAGQLDTLHLQCLAIPELDVLAELKQMKELGTCPDSMLDGVAQTEVTAAPCADTRSTCAAIIASGMFTCKDDFGPGGDMVGDCDQTCGMCQDGHRLLQVIKQRCSDADFSAGADAIDTACCDGGTCDGLPTTCDAKCAIMYNGFFEQCQTRLQLLGADSMVGYTDLHRTCSALPIEPLLRAVAACSVKPCQFEQVTSRQCCASRNEICDHDGAPCNTVTTRGECETLCRANDVCVSYEFVDYGEFDGGGTEHRGCQLSTTCTAEVADSDSPCHQFGSGYSLWERGHCAAKPLCTMATAETEQAYQVSGTALLGGFNYDGVYVRLEGVICNDKPVFRRGTVSTLFVAADGQWIVSSDDRSTSCEDTNQRAGTAEMSLWWAHHAERPTSEMWSIFPWVVPTAVDPDESSVGWSRLVPGVKVCVV